jgi:PKD repeat protein
MRKYLHALLVLLLCTFPILGMAQLNPENVDPGPYGQSSNITVPNQLSAGTNDFAANNTFTLFLSDGAGNFANERLIGSYAGFFSTFINGVIPANTPAGNGYRLRIKSSSPALVFEFTTAFRILAIAGPVAGVTANANVTLDKDAFGWCGSAIGDNKSIVLERAANAPANQKLTFKNELSQQSQEVAASAVGYNLSDIDRSYYTIRVSSEVTVNGQIVKSNRSYLLLNQPSRVNVGGETAVGCLDPALTDGVDISFNVGISGENGIQNNYPGSIYRITWGDKKEDTYTHATLMRNRGVLVHNYKSTSCGELPIDLGNNTQITNSFRVSVTTLNPFCNTDPVSATIYAKIYSKPIAKIDPNTATAACINTPVIFSNKSIKGNNSNCSNTMIYEWYIDGVLASVKESFVYPGFTTTGIHTVKLIAKNDVGLCSPSEDIRTICVQNPPKPSFNFNGNIGATGCAPTVFKPINTSIIDASCNTSNSFRWEVTGGTVTYLNGTSATSAVPEFNFTKPGIYKIRLIAITASCGEVATEAQTIVINSTPIAELSPNVQLCSLGSYKFCDCISGPTLTKLSGTQQNLEDTYTWTVTGGNYEFDASTANTKFPTIKFLEYKTYTVSVTHKNSCESVTKTQQLTFIPSPTIEIKALDSICYDDPIALEAVITGEVSTFAWVGGNGTFSAGRNAKVTNYLPTAAERTAGKVELVFRATTALAAPCAVIESHVSFAIKPKAQITSSPAIANCNSSPLNYTITSNLPQTSYSWTASGPASVSGYSSGSGNVINDVLVSANPEVDAVITYVITPVNGGCAGVPLTLKVTIGNIRNQISTTAATICSGMQALITGNDLSTLGAGYSYTWERSLDNGATWTVISGQNKKDLTLVLVESQQFRRTVTGGNCSSVSETIRVNVLPPLANNVLTEVPAVCQGFAPQALTGSTPTGGDGNYNYQWQISTDKGTTWTNITGAVLASFTPGVLNTSTMYRRLVSTNICSGTFQSTSNAITVVVNPKPTAEFSFVSDKGCAPFLIDDKNIITKAYPDRNDIYSWYANDVLIGTGITFPKYTISTDNTYIIIKLVVSSPFGCTTDSTSHVFNTQQRVSASFTQSLTESCGPTQVTFKSTTPALAGSTLEWDFGNGVKSTNANPTIQNYPVNPNGRDTTYTVKLTVRSSCGDNTFISKVIVKALPQAVFSPNKTTGCSPMLVTFTNTSPGTGNVYYYDFGDGTAPVKKTDNSPVNHTFVSGSIKDYVVTMVTENSCGRSAPTKYTIRVSPNTILPELVVNSDQKQGCAPFTVTFYNNTSGANSFMYNFGDGSVSGPTRTAPEAITHTFTKGGVYEVTLTASNGCSDTTTTETITVYDQPLIQFSADQRTGCPGLNIKFKNESVGGVSYLWDFGDGSPKSSELSPEHVYTGNQEFYTVTLTAVNNLGCSNVKAVSQFIHVIPPPVAKFNVLPGRIINIPNYTFQFEDESDNDPDQWLWDFGDGNTSTAKSPNHSYADTGSYKVTLRVTNKFNCFSETSQTVQVVGVPGYLYVPNSFMPNSGTLEIRTFKAKGSGLESYRLSIFNKWGEMLWTTDKLEEGRPAEGWDGTFKSSLLPQGVYYWKIEAAFINGMPWKGMSLNGSAPKRTGTINLIR